MYISELDRPWLETPFLFQGFEVQTSQEMDVVKKHCKYVYIDAEKGADVLPSNNRAEYESRMRAIQVEEERIDRTVRQLVDSPATPRSRPAYVDQVPLEQEIVRAREVETDAREVMHEIIRDVQKDKDFNIARATKAVTSMVESILRNPDAMVCLT